MTNDTKYAATMSGDSRYSGSMTNLLKFRPLFLATQALNFLMTEDNDFIVISDSGEMTNETKY